MTIAALLLLAAGGTQEAAPRPSATDPEGFTSLFDGTGTEGWRQAGPGGFRIENGAAAAHGGMGLWYYEKRSFRDFILKLEFQQARMESNSGVFVRFPRVNDDPWRAAREGYEIQIAGGQVGKHSTGAIYSFQAPTEVPLRPAGEWNEYEITCIGQHYYVRLNGRLVNVFQATRSLSGMIGLQNHDDKNDGRNLVRFRNIRVKELPARASSYHVLFEGDRKGWKMCGPGAFEVAEGALVSQGGMGLLWHERPFADFVLLLEWRVERREDNSGVFLRFPDPGDDPMVAVRRGYEIQIHDAGRPGERTGSVYSLQDAREAAPFEPGRWNFMEVSAAGSAYEVRINGRGVNTFAGERSRSGHIGLQNHDAESIVRFRNIRVVELKSE